jgi:hypothetical protein
MAPPPRANSSSDEALSTQIVWDSRLVRTVNDEILAIAERHGLEGDLHVLCECANGCLERITISPDRYGAIRVRSRCFIVIPGHVDPGAEDVVEETARYKVVQKRAADRRARRPAALDSPPPRQQATR